MPWEEAAETALTSNAGGTPLLRRETTGPAVEAASVHQYAWRGTWVVAARGAYDLNSIQPLTDALASAVRDHPVVVLDASGVTFADSTLLNLLILTHQSGKLRLVAPSSHLRRLCEITGVDGVLDIRETLDAATGPS
ncbi:STAS domain-containing protein [Streptomyces sp. NPDC017943]|uniref:STAS domain-containing protein n=1 Tax=Streptomyces sp. NPDC017943 TaxID=3365019 RepID=UPI0037942786